ncbi:MAG: LamG-like jellyroll fold domain-containing protein [Phycisphaerae bacterium]
MYRSLTFLISFILLLYLAMNAQANLVGHWQFEGNLNDLSGNGNDTTAQGDAAIENDPERGLVAVLDGNGDYLEIPNSNSLNITSDQITLASWVYFNDVSGGPEIVLAKIFRDGQHSAPYFAYNLCILSNGTPRLMLVTSGSERRLPGSPNLESERWYHMAGTYDGSEMILYVDGEVSATMNAMGNINGYDTPLLLGINGGRGEPMTGKIDDVRIYNHVLDQVEIQAIMLQIGGGYPYAMALSPKDGAIHEETWVNLSWRPGDYAVSHDVYIGESFDDVDAGAESTFHGNQTAAFIVAGFPGFPYPDGLVPGTTYYWRIDEVNDTEPNSPWKGDVWSFSIPPKTAYSPDPADAAEQVDPDANLSWTGGFGSKLHTVYFGESFDDVSNASGGSPQGATTYDPGRLKMAETYYWRVDEFDAIETHKGDVWSFITEGAVGSPNPANGSVHVTQTPVLTWEPGLGATHEVYFGTDATSLELKSSGNLGSESYDPGQLEWNTTYYWRIDEANSANADSPWTGPLWSFTTANFLIIDDMESYNDLDPADPASNRIFNAWIDGYDDPTNGSLVGYETPLFAEQTIVHSGNQSMPMSYDNSVGKSEATLTLTSNRDWTVKGVDTLTIWFRGDSGNTAENLYVALNGKTRVDNDNPDAATLTRWTPWNINLQTFADQGVNLTNVNSITLGLSSVTGGTGMMYFDDIRLYPPAP